MAILNRFLKFLELLEQIVDFFNLLSSPAGYSAVLCLFAYGLLLMGGCNGPTAAILAGAIAMTLYSIVQQPDA